MVVGLVVLTLVYLVKFSNLVSYITKLKGDSFISYRDRLKTNLRFALFFFIMKKKIHYESFPLENE